MDNGVVDTELGEGDVDTMSTGVVDCERGDVRGGRVSGVVDRNMSGVLVLPGAGVVLMVAAGVVMGMRSGVVVGAALSAGDTVLCVEGALLVLSVLGVVVCIGAGVVLCVLGCGVVSLVVGEVCRVGVVVLGNVGDGVVTGVVIRVVGVVIRVVGVVCVVCLDGDVVGTRLVSRVVDCVVLGVLVLGTGVVEGVVCLEGDVVGARDVSRVVD